MNREAHPLHSFVGLPQLGPGVRETIVNASQVLELPPHGRRGVSLLSKEMAQAGLWHRLGINVQAIWLVAF